MKRILLVRFGSIGNTLITVPALRALRKSFQDAYICMIVDKIGLELLNGCPYLDEIILYDMNGEHKSLWKYLKFILALRRRRFNVSIHFKRFLRSELIGFLSGAKKRIGFMS